MNLQHTERGGLTEHAGPGRGVEFVVARLKHQRVRAIGTAKRAAVRQLGEQAERFSQAAGFRHVKVPKACQNSKSLFSARPESNFATSARTRSLGALKVFARSATIASSVTS